MTLLVLVGTKKSGVGRRIHNIPIISTIHDLNHLESKSKNFELQRIIVSDHNIDSKIIESLYIFSKKKWLCNRYYSKTIKFFT